MPPTFLYRCTDCRKLHKSGHPERWCPDCGGELKAYTYSRNRKRSRGRR